MLVARRRERLEALARELDAEFELCDVADRAQVERVAAAVGARHPSLGLLVNNAGIPGRTGFLGGETDQIERVLRVNYLGGVWCLRAFLPALDRGRPSHVVNVVSVAGTVAVPSAGPYCASKHAQLAFSRAVAAELRPRGIRVHTVNPGYVETEGFPQAHLLRRPLGRRLVARPELVAAAILVAVEEDRLETYVPGWYRVAALAQAAAPAAVARALAGVYRRRT